MIQHKATTIALVSAALALGFDADSRASTPSTTPGEHNAQVAEYLLLNQPAPSMRNARVVEYLLVRAAGTKVP